MTRVESSLLRRGVGWGLWGLRRAELAVAGKAMGIIGRSAVRLFVFDFVFDYS